MIKEIEDKLAIHIVTDQHPAYRYYVGYLMGTVKLCCLDQMKGVWVQDLGLKCNPKNLSQLKLDRIHRQEQRKNVV